MFITKSKHEAALAAQKASLPTWEQFNQLRNELHQARDLKTVLEKLGLSANSYGTFLCKSGFDSTSGSFSFPDEVAQYVDDFYGGKVIKQEATKVIHISRTGEVKIGLTKRKPDEHFPYLLDRQAP